MIVRDLIAITATSGPSERIFSKAGNTLTDNRQSLHSKTLQCCEYVKSIKKLINEMNE